MNHHRYEPFPAVELKDRMWPDRRLTRAPGWCSVCLRDGNQALIEPMDSEKKLKLFNLLVAVGFKEIEVGFPAASQTDYDFVRKLIEEDLIPDDVMIQVLTQARSELIEKTFRAVRGADRVIMHLYNSTSTLQRRVVFGLDCRGVKAIAVNGVKLIKKLAEQHPETDWVFQYSPESFTGTELDFAAEICNAVLDIWQPMPDKKAIINLPATVEMSTPNIYADMIEWMHMHLAWRPAIVLSLHTHNDRGTGIAATELGLLAGAERVEGTLFGNGERTGNADIVTLALNLMHQGIDPGLDFSDITQAARVVEECTNIPIHPRHPYAGELAFTAFSGSHQDAIGKGLAAQRAANSVVWSVPYLHVDPMDIGRDYQPLIRINSQSGKGGIAHVMERDFKMQLPRGLQIDFSTVVQKVADKMKREILPKDLIDLFEAEYFRTHPYELVEYSHAPVAGGREITVSMRLNGVTTDIRGRGNGPVDAFVNALQEAFDVEMSVTDLHEHAISGGSDATAVAYIPVRFPGRPLVWGVGRDADTTAASLRAVVSALNRSA